MGIISDLLGSQDEPAVRMTGADGKPVSYTTDQLAEMDHATLYALRDKNSDNKAVSATLAPYEHRAFAREATSENPAMAVPIALATPLYAGAKALGFMRDGGTTNPSFNQVGQGLIGVGEGVISGARRIAAL